MISKFFFVLIFFCFYNRIFAQSLQSSGYEIHILNADSLKNSAVTDKYINQLKAVIDSLTDDAYVSSVYYNLAICYSVKQQPDSTYWYILKCIEASSGYNNLVLTDNNFDFLHQDPCWEQVISKADSVYISQNPGITNKELAIDLYHIFLRDQHVRGLGLKRIDVNLIEIDKENLRRVEEIIQQHGWPTYSMVGKQAGDGAFLVVQHANTTVQRKYFKLLFKAAGKGEASKESVALLMDRISVHMKGVQIFGTQVFRTKDSITGGFGPYKYYPIKDETIVDSLRNEFGLIPLKQYLALFGIDYKIFSK